MIYTTQWERLADTARQVMSACQVAEDEAKAAICRAIADGTVRIRVTLDRHASTPMTSKSMLDGKDLDIPAHLKPEDLGWPESRPLEPWSVRRGSFRPSGYWHLKLIEVCRADVAAAFCPPARPQATAQPASKDGAARRSQPTRNRAEAVIKKLYPEGVPEAAVLPNAILCRRVGEKLKAAGLPGVSDDTILRAAGRRRK
jgi:hypothetical protein